MVIVNIVIFVTVFVILVSSELPFMRSHFYRYHRHCLLSNRSNLFLPCHCHHYCLHCRCPHLSHLIRHFHHYQWHRRVCYHRNHLCDEIHLRWISIGLTIMCVGIDISLVVLGLVLIWAVTIDMMWLVFSNSCSNFGAHPPALRFYDSAPLPFLL